MVLAVKKTPNHILHLLLSIITGGLWLPIWFILSVTPENKFLCQECGAKTLAKPPRRWRQ